MGFLLAFVLPLLAAAAVVVLVLRRSGFATPLGRPASASPPAPPPEPARHPSPKLAGPVAQTAAVVRLEHELRAALSASGLLPPGEDAEGADLVLVHNGLTGHDVILLFIVHLPEDEPRAAPPAGLTPRGLFAALNDGLPPRRRFRKLGALEQPVPADVYRVPGA